MTADAVLDDIALPEFGEPSADVETAPAAYEARQRAALARMAEAGLDALVVYGDREHAANLHFLTGYDPRFEEAVLVLAPGRDATLLVGNEGWGYAELAAGPFRRVLHQSFSLLGQPRDRSRALADELADAGLAGARAVGVAGWKTFGPGDPGADQTWLEAPEFVARAVRAAAAGGRVVNATALLMDPTTGLRATLDADQLAWHEAAATRTSQALRNVLAGIRPGMTERQAIRLMAMDGSPHSCHPMLSCGPRAAYGLPSPSTRPIGRGDPATMAYGIWGALNARAGFVAEDEGDLPEGIRDYVPKLVAPYFRAIAEWYAAIGIGVPGGDLHAIVHRRLGDPFFGVGLNPGHLIGLDEWVHSPINAGSRRPILSGMAIQVDVIPATHSAWHTTNIEDGIGIADDRLRAEIRERHPEAWARIEARRAFMSEALGIRLQPEVLPFSNIPAYLPPFWLSPGRAMRLPR